MIFKLSCQVTVSAYTRVEADTLDEAIAEAAERSVTLDYSGSGADAFDEWCVDEVDGSPENIVVEP